MGQPQGLGPSPGALPHGIHTHPGAYHGETRRQGLPTLSVNSPQVPASLCLSFPACQGLGPFWLWGVYICPSVFAGLLWDSSPKLLPRNSRLIGPERSSGLTQYPNPLVGAYSGWAPSVHIPLQTELPTFC